ncbi:thioesterase [Halalkalibacter wakoensis JCM 9140]|uniref:Thioesterase n=1 Tax=Halalkalibacter wakoensis JCM 9140 TaxID=1236970 RepID=W4Q469_9BACI|nr:thioesterase family protein [Halalkalibacter wakoensis]GAE26164.1 thioesterase [Halalkalibacter wakoensis JCM 9140]
MRTPDYIENMFEWGKSFQFFIPVKVRFSETDAFGHVNNTNAFVYFEDVRIEFYKQIGLMKRWESEKNESIIVVANLQCDYYKQIQFGERIKVGTKVEQVGGASLDMHYIALNEDGDICLTGRGTMVQISKMTGQAIPFDEEARRLLENPIQLSE